MTKRKTTPATPTSEAQPDQPVEMPIADDIVNAVVGAVAEEAETNLAALDEIARLQKDLTEAQSKAQEYQDGWLRAVADYQNYKRRVERDQVETYQRAAGSIIKRYLEISDDLALALRNRPQDSDGGVWANGIELIYRKLLTIMENEGVKTMDALGQPFDPNYHEAITMEPSPDHESGVVIDVIKQGYFLGEKVLRPAVVRVAM
jgi:molecular chaperone GrpE